jgi:hypothetical protein
METQPFHMWIYQGESIQSSHSSAPISRSAHMVGLDGGVSRLFHGNSRHYNRMFGTCASGRPECEMECPATAARCPADVEREHDST